MDTMLTSVIAVLGTLAGALVSGLLQHRAARIERLSARREQRRHEQMNAVAALAVALSDHRRAMWKVRDAILSGNAEQRVQDLRDESHRTRSAVTDPSVRLRLLILDETVRAAAASAIDATYVMREAADLDELQVLRASAIAAHDDFVNAAGAFLGA